ncbi:MAG: hypothetical protein CVV34_01390, partial [Methanomicrobiales archaeon HGW-Methanomicrobiales-5]
LIGGGTQQPVTPVTTPSLPASGSPAANTNLIELSQAQPNASLTLDSGVFILAFQTEGARKMQFAISGFEDYEMTELTTTGPFSGSLTFGPVIKTGTYTFNITGNGSWTAQVIRADRGTTLKVPVNLSGSGTQVTPFFYLEKGQYIFERNETGISSPQYFLRYANGSFLMDANNTYVQPGFGEDSPHPFLFIYITESGDYFMNTVSRTNPDHWTASIIPSPVIPIMGPGPVIPEKGTH